MNNGVKSTITRLWNQTRDEERIAKSMGLEVSDVKAYLKTRRGYPNGEIYKGTRIRNDTRPLRVDDAKYLAHGPTPKPTLPKLKFLGDC